MGTILIIILVLGAIALAAILFTNIRRPHDRGSPADIARTEAATREFREHGADNAPENRVER